VDRYGRPIRAVPQVEPQEGPQRSAASEESSSTHLHPWFLLGPGVSSLRARQEPFARATTRSHRTEVTALTARRHSPGANRYSSDNSRAITPLRSAPDSRYQKPPAAPTTPPRFIGAGSPMRENPHACVKARGS